MEAEPQSAAPSEGPSFKGIERELVEAAAPLIEGQTPRAVYVGKIHMPLAWRKGRGVIVTDRAVHIFNVNLKRVKIRRKMATLNRPVAVKLTGFGLKLGDERKIYAIGHRERAAMKEAAALAEQPPS